MDVPMTVLATLILAIVAVEVWAIVKLTAVRRKEGRQMRNMLHLPKVKRLLWWCRGAWFASVPLAFLGVAVVHEQMIILILLPTTVLMTAAAWIANTSYAESDSDSGG